MTRRSFVLAALFAVLFGLGWWAGRSGARGDLYANLDLFVEVMHKVQQNYVDPVNPGRLVDGALKGMLKDLDPYSQYLDERSYLNLQDATQNKFNFSNITGSPSIARASAPRHRGRHRYDSSTRGRRIDRGCAR